MNTLLTGITGLLGSSIVKSWGAKGNLFGVYLGKYVFNDTKNVKYYVVDVRDKEKLRSMFQANSIDVVLHTAGEARVDFCEINYKEAYSSNVIGTRNMVELCKEYGAKLVYISTNAVFDGTKAPYKESDTPHPINTYGRIKLECEKLIQDALRDFLIIRPILMYGWNVPEERDNVVTWLLKKLQNNEVIKLVDDVFDNALYVVRCADCILKLIEENRTEIYHIAGNDVLNRYQFGMLVAEVFGYNNKLIEPVKSEYFAEIAPRPKNTSYDTTKIQRDLGISPIGVKDGLLNMLKEKNRG